MPSRTKHHDRSLWDKIWKAPNGRVVIYQVPNLWLLAWLIITLFSLFTSGTMSSVLGYLGSAALTVWSLLELFYGVNYFRRALGAAVLTTIIAGLF